MLRLTPGDPWDVEQHHWNTGAKENQQLNPGGPTIKYHMACHHITIQNSTVTRTTALERSVENSTVGIKHVLKCTNSSLWVPMLFQVHTIVQLA